MQFPPRILTHVCTLLRYSIKFVLVQSVHEVITYSCEHCDHKARWKRDLLRHVQSIHEGITYSCDHKAKQKSCLR